MNSREVIKVEDYNTQIKKYEETIKELLFKLKDTSSKFFVSEVERRAAEKYIGELTLEIKRLKGERIKYIKPKDNPNDCLERLKKSLGLNEHDVNKITEDYLRRKKFNKNNI